jgi:putative SOS response-associated peptidase YedK
MCGRYTLSIDKSTIEHRFGVRFYVAQAEYEPTFTAARSQHLPMIRTYYDDMLDPLGALSSGFLPIPPLAITADCHVCRNLAVSGG